MLDSNKAQLLVSSEPCGFRDDEPLYLITISNDDTVVELANLGAAITAIFTADRNGKHHKHCGRI